MSNTGVLNLLAQNKSDLSSAVYWLERSYKLCTKVGVKVEYEDFEYDMFETLTARYARCIDLIVRKVLRTLDIAEFDQPGTLIDTVNRAEKRGFIDDISSLRRMTDLRNEIAHDYIKSELLTTFGEVLLQTSKLIQLARNIDRYIGLNFNF